MHNADAAPGSNVTTGAGAKVGACCGPITSNYLLPELGQLGLQLLHLRVVRLTDRTLVITQDCHLQMCTGVHCFMESLATGKALQQSTGAIVVPAAAV